MKNISLSPIKKKHTPSYSLQRSNSLPDFHEEFLSLSKELSEEGSEINKKRVPSIERDISSFKLPSSSTKDLLNETNTIPVDSGDSVKSDKHLFIKSKNSFSCPLEYPNEQFKQKLKALDDSILNYNYLKNIEKSNSVSPPPIESAKITFQPKMSLLGKKLALLEKRFSPSKEMKDPQFNPKLKNVENVNCLKILKSSQALAPADEVVTTISSSDSVEIMVGIENSESHQTLKSQSNSQSLSEKCDVPENAFDSLEGRSGKVSKTTVYSFVSPPVPCCQLLATEASSPSQPVTSQMSDEFDTLRKSQVSNPPVVNEPSTEVFSPSQQISQQKSDKFNPQNESFKAELSGKTMALEKPNGSVCSSNFNEKIEDLVSSKESGTKRKRRSRSEKSSKKLDAKKLKRIDFQFSSTQIKTMIKIMKIFHT